MTGTWWIGVDPGAQQVGICVVDPAGAYLAHRVISRPEYLSLPDWCRRIHDVVDRAGPELVGHKIGTAIAVETVVAPNPHVRRKDGNSLTNVTPLLDTAAVFGAIAVIENITPIRPAGHGSHPYGAYPDQLITAGERRTKGWQLRKAGQSSAIRHARSAYDIAQTARSANPFRRTRNAA